MSRGGQLFRWMLIVWGVLLIASCAKQQQFEPPRAKLAVLDFKLIQPLTTPREIKGWWFGSRDLYYNPNVGEKLGDALADELKRRCPFLDVYSRLDLKYYLLGKKEILRRTFPNLTDKEREQIIENLDPLDIGRDLGVDKLLIGEITSCYTSHNRTFHWWSSVMKVNAKLIDIDSGRVEWEKNIKEREMFKSWVATGEEIARRIVMELNEEVFYK